MPTSRSAVEDFLYAEAGLLDNRQFEEWMDLFTDDAVYWVPAGHDDIDQDDLEERENCAVFKQSGQCVSSNGLLQGQRASGGSDIKMASVLPPVFRPNCVPRSYKRLNST